MKLSGRKLAGIRTGIIFDTYIYNTTNKIIGGLWLDIDNHDNEGTIIVTYEPDHRRLCKLSNFIIYDEKLK